jgi:hypothetical protein
MEVVPVRRSDKVRRGTVIYKIWQLFENYIFLALSANAKKAPRKRGGILAN